MSRASASAKCVPSMIGLLLLSPTFLTRYLRCDCAQGHFKNKFCAECRARGIEVPKELVYILTPSCPLKNTLQHGFWNPSKVCNFRVVNQTFDCFGPPLLLTDTPVSLVNTLSSPDTIVDTSGVVKLNVSKGTLVPVMLSSSARRQVQQDNREQARRQGHASTENRSAIGSIVSTVNESMTRQTVAAEVPLLPDQLETSAPYQAPIYAPYQAPLCAPHRAPQVDDTNPFELPQQSFWQPPSCRWLDPPKATQPPESALFVQPVSRGQPPSRWQPTSSRASSTSSPVSVPSIPSHSLDSTASHFSFSPGVSPPGLSPAGLSPPGNSTPTSPVSLDGMSGMSVSAGAVNNVKSDLLSSTISREADLLSSLSRRLIQLQDLTQAYLRQTPSAPAEQRASLQANIDVYGRQFLQLQAMNGNVPGDCVDLPASRPAPPAFFSAYPMAAPPPLPTGF